MKSLRVNSDEITGRCDYYCLILLDGSPYTEHKICLLPALRYLVHSGNCNDLHKPSGDDTAYRHQSQRCYSDDSLPGWSWPMVIMVKALPYSQEKWQLRELSNWCDDGLIQWCFICWSIAGDYGFKYLHFLFLLILLFFLLFHLSNHILEKFLIKTRKEDLGTSL